MSIKVDCISDLHGYYPKLEGGDLLIIAGDLTARDQEHEYYFFNTWLWEQDYEKKIVIAGNHDNLLQKDPDQYLKDYHNVEYLCDSGTKFHGFNIWGSPWTKTFDKMNFNCKAFTYDTEEELSDKWSIIPFDIDILITHSPPFGISDTVDFRSVGSTSLFVKCSAIQPKLHVFGHIHENGGKDKMICWKNSNVITRFINASIIDEVYDHVNKPFTIDLSD